MSWSVVPACDAQPAKVPRIGVLAERPASDPMLEAFVAGLRELGYVEGRTIVIEWRYGQGGVENYPRLAAELAALDLDVLVVGGSIAAQSARAAAPTVPIVFTAVGDPVAAGLVSRLSHPGGNATGLSNVAADLAGKQLALLKSAAPAIRRVAVIHNPLNSAPSLANVRDAARSLGVELGLFGVRKPGEVPRALAATKTMRPDAILALSDPVVGNSMSELVRFTLAQRLPSIYTRAQYADEGGLLAYGPDFRANYRRAATYVDRILKGAKPGDLAVEQPTTFELVINLKTAKALGLTIPASLRQQAERVVE
ncbi:MAG TPA: ABC transporter substrate-binding protein [Casimicrobiaceae bacterium]|nr:ABC transporter substrate-binding protein [Casimicrobiaceae bacterium]